MGIHLIAPDVVATMEEMLNWREAIRDVLASHRADVPWGDVFDQAVYKGGSFRMAMSCKMVPCPEQEHDANCCGGKLRVNAGRKYEFDMFFDRNGVRSMQYERILRSNTHLMVCKTSIRHGQSKYEKPAPMRASSKRREAPVAHTKRLDGVVNDLPPEHRNLLIIDESGGRLRVCGEGARYCTIVGREHRSSTVYYVVDERSQTATQRCWCRKVGCHGGKGAPLCVRPTSALPFGFSW